MRSFEYSDAKSHKFWNIEVSGKSFTVTYGKIGTAGQSQTKSFPSADKAQSEADKLIKEKTGKGYVETTVNAVMSDREALENAVRANPHDKAPYSALADYLIDHGEPLGEFMRVQIALEDESLPKEQRTKLKAQEKALLKKHADLLVGKWADAPGLDSSAEDWAAPPDWTPYRLTRGLLTGLEFGDLTYGVAREIAKSTSFRFVHELIIHGIAYEEGEDLADDADEDEEIELPEGQEEFPSQYVALKWPFLRQIRTFRIGGEEPIEYDDYCPNRCHTPGDHIFDFVKQMPDIEELRIMAHLRDGAAKIVSLPMPHLRSLLLYHGWSYPLDRLAKNSSLTKLTELYCHPHALEGGEDPYIRLAGLQAICRSATLAALTHLQLRLADFGDDGVAEIISSGMLKRLKVLDLRHGVITDKGAKALAARPELRNLVRLDLAWNRIGEEGTAALQATGVNVHLIQQQSSTADDWETYAQGDIE